MKTGVNVSVLISEQPDRGLDSEHPRLICRILTRGSGRTLGFSYDHDETATAFINLY